MASEDDTTWETMLAIAKAQQQNWYEMLPGEWTVYEESDLPYLKLKIAMAIFGLPEKDSNNAAPPNLENNDFTKYFEYTKQQQEIIDTVYKQILEHGRGYKGAQNSICYNLVYVIYFALKKDVAVARKEKSENKKDKTQEDKVVVNTSPLFKVQKSVKKIVEYKCLQGNGKLGTVKKEHNITEIWFIDIMGRVYKSWEIYKSKNILPPCTMVLPRDGVYQPDLDCLCTEYASTVALEILNSPACKIGRRLADVADTGSTLASVVGIGISLASMFTPVGPVVAGVGVASAAASGVWTVGRSAQNLTDRAKHEESISITDRNALGSWIGIAGSLFGVASSAGTTLITKSAQAGQNISKLSKIASNSVIGGSIFFNGAGILYQGFSIYRRYRDTETIDPADVLFFTAHVFFFSNAVMNVKFAGKLIESSQGRVIEDFESNIRSKSMRKAFNRAKNQAASKSDVVRFVNTKNDILANMKPSANASTSTSENASTSMPTGMNTQTINLKFVNGKVKINNEYLLDPMQFVRDLAIPNASYRASARRSTDASGNVDTTVYSSQVFISLKQHLQAYVESFCGDLQSSVSSRIVEDAKDVLMEMLGITDPDKILGQVFRIGIELLNASNWSKLFIAAALRFILLYVKAHLKKRETSDSAQIYKILSMFLENMEQIIPTLSPAFNVYVGRAHQ